MRGRVVPSRVLSQAGSSLGDQSQEGTQAPQGNMSARVTSHAKWLLPKQQ